MFSGRGRNATPTSPCALNAKQRPQHTPSLHNDVTKRQLGMDNKATELSESESVENKDPLGGRRILAAPCRTTRQSPIGRGFHATSDSDRHSLSRATLVRLASADMARKIILIANLGPIRNTEPGVVPRSCRDTYIACTLEPI